MRHCVAPLAPATTIAASGPATTSAMKSVKYVAMVAVGGMGSLWGTLAVSVVLNFLSLRGYFGTFDDAVFGGILLLIMLFSPDGIMAPDLRRAVGAVAQRLRAGRARPGPEAADAGGDAGGEGR